MNVNDNKYTFIKSNNKDKVAENTLLIHEVYSTKDKIDKYICHGIAPGLESRYILLHKANVSRLCRAVLCCAGWRYNLTHGPRQVRLEPGHDTKIT